MKKLCLLLCLILCCLPVVAQTVESPAKKTEINQAGEEGKKEFDFSDDMEDFKGLFGRTQNVVAEVIPENQYEQFYEDYTVFQRTVKSPESVTYHIPYWETAEITAYFFSGEEENDFKFFVSQDNITYHEVMPEKDESGSLPEKWHKTVYTIKNKPLTEQYIKVEWPDLTGTEFTNWGQALGFFGASLGEPVPSEIQTEEVQAYVIPDQGNMEYSMTAKVLDQAKEEMKEIALTWEPVELPQGVMFDIGSGSLLVGSEAEDLAEVKVKVYITEKPEIEKLVTVRLYTLKPGDINGDMKIDKKDLELACDNFMATPEKENWTDIKRGDVNQDGKIDIYDVAYIARQLSEESPSINEKEETQGV